MAVILPDNHPALEILRSEDIDAISESEREGLREKVISIGILNLMPTKISTEVQILRLIGKTPLFLRIVLLRMKTHRSKHTPEEYLNRYYESLEDIKDIKLDGMIITGAPVELLDFEDVDYWEELKDFMEYTSKQVYSSLYICWGAQAGLYYHNGIQKYPLKEKMFGVFAHSIINKESMMCRGFDDVFYVPHSRHTEINKEDILRVPELTVLSESQESGVYIVEDKKNKRIFVTGHSEYDENTLKLEYERDCSKGTDIKIPKNYFINDNPQNEPLVKWRSHANLLYLNWLHHYVCRRKRECE